MSQRNTGIIGQQIFTATLLPKRGDRDDFSLRVQGPEPSTDFEVPLSITRTILSIWGAPNPSVTAETLGKAIFHQFGTAKLPPENGYWFDSYNSGDTVEETVNRIYNSDTTPFIKNFNRATWVNSLASGINQQIQELDEFFSDKFGFPFFKSLEDLSEESQRANDLDTPATDNANYLYRISILSGLIDHINVRLPAQTSVCPTCHKPTIQPEGSLQALRRWLTSKLDSTRANDLTQTFQMIKNLRKQYPIHDHYTTANQIRSLRREITIANDFFGVISHDYGHNSVIVISKFEQSLRNIKTALE